MINLPPYNKKKPEDFFKDIIRKKSKTKSDPDFHHRVDLLAPGVLDQYKEFDGLFLSNRLEELQAFGYTGRALADLHKLYHYKNTYIQALKSEVTTLNSDRKIGTCQNCTISEINSMDHILPKIDYAEFSVHPNNLFPSCTICNSYKSSIWATNGQRSFLNLYLDILPVQQYLFVDIIDGDTTPRAKFHLKNTNGIDQGLYRLIESHYDGLHLPERFARSIDQVVTPLKNTIKSFLGDLSIDRIKQINLEKIQSDMENFGKNYWKSILEERLMEDDDFINAII